MYANNINVNTQSMKHKTFTKYVVRITRDMNLTENDICKILVIFEIAIHNFTSKNHELQYNNIYACSILSTMKMYDDNVYNNEYFAFHLKIPLKTLNQLEITFLEIMNWNIYIHPHEYQKKYNQLKTPGKNYLKLITNICKNNIPQKYNKINYNSFLFIIEIMCIYLSFD